jgi:hypothetical protein
MKRITKHAIASRWPFRAIAAVCATAFVVSAASSADANDHNNIDANRPLTVPW